MGELASVYFDHWLVEPLQEIEPFLGDAGGDHPAVALLPGAGDQRPRFQPVQQASDVGIPGDHALANLLAGEALRAGTPQDAEQIVLARGEADRLEKRQFTLAQSVGSS